MLEVVAMQTEKRASERIPFNGRAYLTFDGKCRADEVLDVSSGGLQLKSNARIRPGKQVDVFLPLPAERGWRLCLIKGEVVRRQRGTWGSGRLGIALRSGQKEARELLSNVGAEH